MMITSVERNPKARGRAGVHVDGAPAFDVLRETARHHGLRPGRTIEQQEIDAIVAADRRRSAMGAALAMLARRQRSEQDVRRRLARGRFTQDVTDETVARLRDLKLLDDAEYARAWAESRDRASPRGRRMIVRELRGAGVAIEIAREAAAGICEDEAAYRLAAKRLPSLRPLGEEAFRTRLGSQLQRRGFAWDTITRTVARCCRELGHAASEDGRAGV